jgi:hypothetical protein
MNFVRPKSHRRPAFNGMGLQEQRPHIGGGLLVLATLAKRRPIKGFTIAKQHGRDSALSAAWLVKKRAFNQSPASFQMGFSEQYARARGLL